MYCVLVVAFCHWHVCCGASACRHSAIFCPIIPDPSAIFKEMIMNGNKDLKVYFKYFKFKKKTCLLYLLTLSVSTNPSVFQTTLGNLYTPVPESIETCEVTPVTENSDLQQHSWHVHTQQCLQWGWTSTFWQMQLNTIRKTFFSSSLKVSGVVGSLLHLCNHCSQERTSIISGWKKLKRNLCNYLVQI